MLEVRDEHGQENRREGCSKVGRVYLREATALSSSSCVSTTSCSSPISFARTAVNRSAVRKYLDTCAGTRTHKSTRCSELAVCLLWLQQWLHSGD